MFLLTLYRQHDLLDLLGLRVDPTFIRAAVVVAHLADEQIPVFGVEALHADAVVVYRPAILQTDEDFSRVDPNHLWTDRDVEVTTITHANHKRETCIGRRMHVFSRSFIVQRIRMFFVI